MTEKRNLKRSLYYFNYAIQNNSRNVLSAFVFIKLIQCTYTSPIILTYCYCSTRTTFPIFYT